MDDMPFLGIIVHFDGWNDPHRRSLRVEVTKFTYEEVVEVVRGWSFARSLERSDENLTEELGSTDYPPCAIHVWTDTSAADRLRTTSPHAIEYTTCTHRSER